ncbi:tower [Haloarcula sinaiiensis tailed virus 1]|uniref:Tower n=1 Tax=Haloarcula sinaiiensis tailed virus 1 TaxID=1262530 RepID=R9QSP2_9CAUD|nr:tower [Haloarcula sinaiiensis tailed virus 1]AGC34557.1 tower [Haloarcula sinaiiensis tailed virus 1]
MTHGEDFDPSNYRRYELINKIFHYGIRDAEFDSVSTGSLNNIADYIVGTVEELQSAFNNLESGETIYVGSGNYRTEQWLDIDVNDVRIVGEGGQNSLIKPADGADVGGIRIGVNSPVSSIEIDGVGFDGNEAAMTDSVKRLHAYIVDDADDVTIRDCYATRTHPYHEHGSGGSGITVRDAATNVSIVNNRIDDIGDRAVQIGGKAVTVYGNRITNGYDRAVSLNLTQADGNAYLARNSVVANNTLAGSVDGSLIGCGGSSSRSDRGYYAIIGNVGYGDHKNFCKFITSSVENVAIIGNSSVKDTSTDTLSAVEFSDITVRDLLISNNTFHEYNQVGISMTDTATVENFAIQNNVIDNPADAGVLISGSHGIISGNQIITPKIGVNCTSATQITIQNNYVYKADSHGINIDSGVSDAQTLITSNYIYKANQDDVGAKGINLQDGGVSIVGNYINENIGQAIYVPSGLSRVAVQNNYADAGRFNINSAEAISNNVPRAILSATPDNPTTGTAYYDDGANTGSGTLGKRVYDGASWTDAWTV